MTGASIRGRDQELIDVGVWSPRGNARLQRASVVVYGSELLFCQFSASKSYMIKGANMGLVLSGTVMGDAAARWLGAAQC